MYYLNYMYVCVITHPPFLRYTSIVVKPLGRGSPMVVNPPGFPTFYAHRLRPGSPERKIAGVLVPTQLHSKHAGVLAGPRHRQTDRHRHMGSDRDIARGHFGGDREISRGLL